MSEHTGVLDAYVTNIAVTWAEQASPSPWHPVDGSLVFVDISGFTNLSERLARRGRIGAEELTGVLDMVFGNMLEVVYRRGGFLLKFGGDALLLLFDGEDHVLDACAAVVEMRAALKEASELPTSVGRISLRMSSGVHTGSVDAFLVGDSHREIIVTGPAASMTTEMEATADAGEIVVSDAVRAAVPSDFIGAQKGHGWLLKKRKIAHPASGRARRGEVPPDIARSLLPRSLVEHLSSGSVESEHRIATIGFIKFTGVDGFLEEHGPEALGFELDDLVSHVQRASEAEGVTFLASDIDADGGKLILGTGVPTAQHDDEGRMLRTMRTVLDREGQLRIRAGVNRGHVFAGNIGTQYRSTYTVMGDTVNLAARLMAAAGYGELYVTPSTLHLSSTLFRTTALPPFEVKGKSLPVQAFSVAEETGVRPPDLSSDLPFKGRDAETEMLVGVVNTCSRVGRGGMMTVTGDTGIGKSRLVTEALDRCDGMDTLFIQAEPNGSDNPYWAFRDPLRKFLGIERAGNEEMARLLEEKTGELAPDLLWALPLIGRVAHVEVEENERTSALEAQFRPAVTADSLIGLLSGGFKRPVAIVAEDAQWLDEASLSLLERIGVAARSRPWTVLITARRQEDFTPLGDEVVLSPLDEAAVRAITVESTRATPLRPHELDAVVTQAGGNPLFLNEILRVIAETGTASDLPESLDAVVTTEIDTLPLQARKYLRYSSVLGRRFRRDVLDAFMADEDIHLDDATRERLRGFIHEDGDGRVTFRHSVVHEVAYNSLPYAKRRELHGRAGLLIESQSMDDLDSVAEYLAGHFSQSGDHGRAYRYAMTAAERAREAYANTDAAAQYQRALAAVKHLSSVDPKELSEVWSKLGSVQDLAGQSEDARKSYGSAIAFADGDAVRVADLRVRRAETWYLSGKMSQARRELTLGRNSLEVSGGSSPEAARSLAGVMAYEASIDAGKGDPFKALASAKAAIEQARVAGDDESAARAYTVLDWANFLLGNDEPRLSERAVEIYRDLGLYERSVAVLNNLGGFSYYDGDWDQAIAWYRQSVEAAERSGNVVVAANTRTGIAEVFNGQRRFEEALNLVEEAQRVIRSSNADEFLVFAQLQSARARAGLGNLEEVENELSDLFSDQVAVPGSEFTGEIGILLAETLIALGKPSAALDVLGRLKAEDSDAADLVAIDIERVRARAFERQGNTTAAIELWESALAGALEEDDLYAELLVRESLVSVQPGVETGNAIRLEELRGRLGIETPSRPRSIST